MRQITLAHKLYTRKINSYNKRFPALNQIGLEIKTPRPLQKSSKLKTSSGSHLYGNHFKQLLDIPTFSLKDEHVLSSISYSLKATQAGSKYKSHATTPPSPSKLRNLANNLTTSQRNHNTQYSVYPGPTCPKFGKQTANRQIQNPIPKTGMTSRRSRTRIQY